VAFSVAPGSSFSDGPLSLMNHTMPNMSVPATALTTLVSDGNDATVSAPVTSLHSKANLAEQQVTSLQQQAQPIAVQF